MKPNEIRQRNTTALLIIDMINNFDFPGGEKLAASSLPVAGKILSLKQRAYKKGIPVIYVNDNFKLWRSSWQEVYRFCSEPKSTGRKISELLQPTEKDYFILKPRHSGFFNTNLPVLLEDLGTKKLIVTGVAGNICVLFTVNDAYMNDFKIIVPCDCIASNTKKENDFALKQMKDLMKVNTGAVKGLRL
ncbi:cysteine hydrolase [Bdellovibrio sp. ZAP7]|uniref:cysteine hydrolase family protein n=1 Tax=Bdellovibrio sp. ZAP7 TaxID=2231053 RepID=UPI00115BC7E4|nr:isochorismatase family cysteine hydrolase [Bdellovibrio sp. ZAP7]QDK44545.1 cysteine hydrolase [Bdellovibrio sp. ZAP7]